MPINVEKNGDWDEYRRLVVTTLDNLVRKNDDQDKAIFKLETQLVLLKAKSGFWGFLAGCVPVLIIVIMYLVFKVK